MDGSFCLQNRNSTWSAISDAFPERDIKEWELRKTPQGFYKKREHRVAAIRWLVEKLDKDPTEFTGQDIKDNRLGGIANIFEVSMASTAVVKPSASTLRNFQPFNNSTE